jgi:hypothetical protein
MKNKLVRLWKKRLELECELDGILDEIRGIESELMDGKRDLVRLLIQRSLRPL